jgi:hypothetical protein
MHIAIDLDGVLLDYNGYVPGQYGEPLKGSLEFVMKMLKRGHQVTVFTARRGHSRVKKHLMRHGFPELPVTSVKSGKFTVFLDDRAIAIPEPTTFATPENIDAMVEKIENFDPWWKKKGSV